MRTEPLGMCGICKDGYQIEDLVFYMVCGHGFCHLCLQHLAKHLAATRKIAKCCVCRRVLEVGEEPQRIYITFMEPEAAKPISVVDGLRQIDIETPAGSILRAAKKIRQEARTADDRTLKSLLNAARELEQRLYPLRAELECEREEMATVLDDRDYLKIRTEEMRSEVTDLRNQLHDAKANLEAALAVAEEAADIGLRAQRERARSDQTIQRYRRARDNKEKELEMARNSLEQKDKQIHILNTKLKILAKQVKQAKRTEDPDDSLQIERPAEVIDDLDDRPRKKRRSGRETTGD
ncbi:hypothetical protein FPV67DRAFT_1510176 [Lyophyllum atratum]|nr:hypothetical protein FPV67DRAFT_1510176 [Lyophyllum atratum]